MEKLPPPAFIIIHLDCNLHFTNKKHRKSQGKSILYYLALTEGLKPVKTNLPSMIFKYEL